jgi:hydrogenase expression/formation protein HypC
LFKSIIVPERRENKSCSDGILCYSKFLLFLKETGIIFKRNRDKSMCLAVPSKIIEINDQVAKVDVDGVIRETSIMLMDDVKIGDYVIVHAGFAINRIDEEAALQTLEDMRSILASEAGRDNGFKDH